MGDFSDRRTTPAQGQKRDFDTYPASCLCGRDTAIALATVTNKNTGKQSTGAASEFCGRNKDNTSNWILQDWYSLETYRGYCKECYAGEGNPGPRKYSDDQVRFAWMWFLGMIAATGENAALKTAFKTKQLTDDQRDKAIEIVNYEAERTGQMDAIPPEYRI